MRLVGIFSILLGIAQWFLPNTATADLLHGRWILLLLFIGTGVALYFFAHRGFRRELLVDLSKRSVAMARVNSSGRSLVRQIFKMDDVESVFVQRSSDRDINVLCFRMRGRNLPIAVAQGTRGDVESLHKWLCRVIGNGIVYHPRRVQSNQPIACMRAAPWLGRQKRIAAGLGFAWK